MIVTVVAFCAFMHMFSIVQTASRSFAEVFFRNFTILITSGLPVDPNDLTSVQLALMFAAVTIFSVFILNMFITVIGEQFILESQNVHRSVTMLRSMHCEVHLLRAKLLPCALMTQTIAAILCIFAMLSALLLQYCFFSHVQTPVWAAALMVLCHVVMLIATFQDPDAPWARTLDSRPVAPRHLWFACPAKGSDQNQFWRTASDEDVSRQLT